MNLKIGILAAAFALWLASCGSHQMPLPEKDKLAEAIAYAETTPITETRLFLGFKFGMTQKEVTAHLDSLEDIGKVYIDKENQYAYDFHTDSKLYNAIMVTFLPEFYHDSLYRMDFMLHAKEESLLDSPVLNMLAAERNFRDADKTGYRDFTTTDISGEEIHTYIKANLIIQFDVRSLARMSYINAPVERRIKDDQRAELEKDRDRTISDF